ncbi:unnamed protein product [Prorocentrum cordatum]|uniref:Uncharacterized protein n=1 Tax=Prorocentrum cordatum TaxID=2364126 RepID=A0ABN9YIT3_9DINO|nr:unnamed protein product [Polarella glacialis]
MADESVVLSTPQVQCAECDQQRPASVCTPKQRSRATGEPISWICGPCNSLKKRISTLRSSDPTRFEGWSELSAEARSELMKNAGALYGPALAAKISEYTVKTKVQENIDTNKASGDYVLVTEVGELDRFKKDKSALALLLARAPRMTCDYTGQEFVWVPTYSHSSEAVNKDRHEQGRDIIAEGRIKKAPAAKKEPREPREPKVKGLPAGLVKKFDKFMDTATERVTGMAASLVTASSEEGKEYVSTALMKRANAAQAKLSSFIEVMPGLFEDGSGASRELVVEKLQEAQHALDDHFDAKTKLEGALLGFLNRYRHDIRILRSFGGLIEDMPTVEGAAGSTEDAEEEEGDAGAAVPTAAWQLPTAALQLPTAARQLPTAARQLPTAARTLRR